MTVDITDKTVLITGSTDGLGRSVARALAAKGARLVLHGRNQERGDALVAELAQLGRRPAHFIRADLGSFAGVRLLAEATIAAAPRLDLLINNAGVGGGLDGDPNREVTADGHELRFGVNYLACVLLTELLLPLLQRSSPSRIVNVASEGQDPLDLANLMPIESYDGPSAYRQSKLAQIMYTLELDRRLQGTGVSAVAVHPAAFMDTNMVKLRGRPVMSTVQEGVDSVLTAAISNEFWAQSGIYFDQTRPSRAHEQAYDAAFREQLMRRTMAMIGIEADQDAARP